MSRDLGDPAQVAQAVAELDAVESALDRARGLENAFRRAQAAGVSDSALVEAARGSDAVARNACAIVVGLEHQARLYAPDSTSEAKGEQPIDEPAAPTEAQVEQSPASSGGTTDDAEDWRTVLMLGAEAEMQSNLQSLSSHDFSPVSADSLGTFELVASQAYCGIAIHPSWWKLFDSPDQRLDFLRQLTAACDFLPMRIAENGLGVTEHELGATSVEFDADCTLIEHDFARFKRAAALLETGGRIQFTVAGLTASERQLMAVAVLHYPGASAAPNEGAEIKVEQITAGRSKARVFLLDPTWCPSTYVAKLDTHAAAEEEKERSALIDPTRYSTYHVTSYGGGAVLLQPVLQTFTSPPHTAPSLARRLDDRFNWERGRDGEEPIVEDLRDAIRRLDTSIRNYAARSAEGEPSKCWTSNEPLMRLATADVAWAISDGTNYFDPATVLEQAKAKFDELDASRVAHGDLHAGNVLLLDDDVPSLIDYAFSGSGHPCFDFARITADLLLRYFRPLVGEEMMRDLFRDLFVNGADFENLRSVHGDTMAGPLNELLVEAAVDFRNSAEGQVTASGDERPAYLATLFVVVAQSLTMSEYESITARALLGAIRPSVGSV